MSKLMWHEKQVSTVYLVQCILHLPQCKFSSPIPQLWQNVGSCD